MIGAHGAGLTNMIYATNPRVMILQGIVMLMSHYFMMALGLGWHVQSHDWPSSTGDGDFSVDIADFTRAVASFMDSP